jgi:predicted AlkP superfamily pyrophosphatase or phosphodiesterase
VLLAVVAAAVIPSSVAAKPRLTVLISIDQFRGDYLTRYSRYFLPAKSKEGVGGFLYLMNEGAYYPNAQYTHFPLFTGPGHAVLSTGGTPSTNGIIGNNWYVPGSPKGHGMYCVEDPASPIVGDDKLTPGMSPKNLRSSTIADEMKMASGGKAKVLTVSFKDRAAILLAGHLSDSTVWYDTNTGKWVTSRFYRPDGTLPQWVVDENGKKQADSYFGAAWKPLLPDEIANNAWAPVPDAVTPSPTVGMAFPHVFNGGLSSPGKQFYSDLWCSPFASEMVLQTALDGVKALDMGKDEIPDFVGINLAANDYVGHAFGPNSPEAFDITLRTDKLLAGFFRGLDATVPGGLSNVVVVLSADHGVAPIPENMEKAGFYAGRIPEESLISAAKTALDAAFGADDWVSSFVEPEMWLNPDAISRHKADPREVRRIAADAVRAVDGIYDVYTRDQLLEGRMPDTPISRKVITGFHPKVSGDLLTVPENLWFWGGGTGGTTHGTPWAYDTHVPIALAGPGIRPGTYQAVASPQQIAATLCSLIGVDPPSGSTAGPLVEALK